MAAAAPVQYAYTATAAAAAAAPQAAYASSVKYVTDRHAVSNRPCLTSLHGPDVSMNIFESVWIFCNSHSLEIA